MIQKWFSDPELFWSKIFFEQNIIQSKEMRGPTNLVPERLGWAPGFESWLMNKIQVAKPNLHTFAQFGQYLRTLCLFVKTYICVEIMNSSRLFGVQWTIWTEQFFFSYKVLRADINLNMWFSLYKTETSIPCTIIKSPFLNLHTP